MNGFFIEEILNITKGYVRLVLRKEQGKEVG